MYPSLGVLWAAKLFHITHSHFFKVSFGAFRPLIDRTAVEVQEMGRQSEGEQHGAKGCRWTGAAAARTKASACGLPALPTDLNNNPNASLTFFFKIKIPLVGWFFLFPEFIAVSICSKITQSLTIPFQYLHIWEWVRSTSPSLPPDGMWWCQPPVSWWSPPHKPQKWSSPAGNCPQSAWHSTVCQGQGTHYGRRLVMRRKRTRSSDKRSCVNEQ